VVAGQPLRIKQRDGLAATHGDRFLDAEDAPLDIARIDEQANRSRIGEIPRSNGWRRHRLRLRPGGLRAGTGGAQCDR